MAFVAAKGSELKDTATLLLALAAEKGIDPWEIRIVHDGFEVPEELLADADRAVLGAEKADEPKNSAPETGDDSGRKTPEAAPEQDHAEEKLDDDGAPVKEAPEKPAAAPKRRGRPPGSHNKPKAAEPAHEDHKPESE